MESRVEGKIGGGEAGERSAVPTAAERASRPRSRQTGALGAVVLLLALIVGAARPDALLATNTIAWSEIDPPAASGSFVSLVQGDVNRDGFLDLVGGTMAAGIGVAAGDGAGKWTSLGTVVATGGYYGLALGDLDNDGDLDLVGAENGSGVHVWAGDGAGGWSEKTSPLATGIVASVAIGDVNGDGNLDIAAGSGGGGAGGLGEGVGVWTGDGAFGWTLASTGLPTVGIATDLALGDVDRDGRVDLVATAYAAGVHAWRNTGGGTWTERSTGLPTTLNRYGVALADLDHDGILDVVAGGEGVGVRAWGCSGGLVWSWVTMSTGLPSTTDVWDVALGDLDHDGDIDIAATTAGSGVGVWTGDGGGSWSAASSGLPAAEDHWGLAMGDWDEDGILDLAAGYSTKGVAAWVDAGTPDGPADWNQIVSPTATGAYQGVDAGDWNHDGLSDVVAAGVGTGIQLWTGDGGNGWDEVAGWTSPDLPTTGTYDGIAWGDIDHNGWPDVVAGSGAGLGLRAWAFTDGAWVEVSDKLPTTGTFTDIAMADLDHDGYLDFAATGDEGTRVWMSVGFESISTAGWGEASGGLPAGGDYTSVAIADLNRDGDPDIVAGGKDVGIGVYEGNGLGAWTARTTPRASGTFLSVAVGDVNGDARPDLVATEDGAGVWAWSGDGVYAWTALARPDTTNTYADVALGDLNNDGWLDLVAGRYTDNGLRAWTGNGGAAWTALSTGLPTTGRYYAVALTEVDNDGLLDLVAAKYGTGSVHVWTRGDGAPPSGWTSFAPSGWISDTQKVDASVVVQDTYSGLDVDSAEYRYLGAGGVWSAWDKAACTGTSNTTAPQTISIAQVNFGQDSGPGPSYAGNAIQFRIADMEGNVGTSADYLVKIDTTPPTNPTSFPDSSHWPGGGCLDDDTIWVDWDGAADATSGLGGYSFAFGTGYTLPDTILDTWTSEGTSAALADGMWYIYVRTRDAAGNWAEAATYDGPYCVDTAPPTNPTGYTSSHTVGVWSRDNTIQISWTGAEDLGSGIFGYSYLWNTATTSTPDTTRDTEAATATSAALADGATWYFHVRTGDRAGNWAAGATHWGPFMVDVTAPTGCWINSPAEATASTFTVNWAYSDATSDVASYDLQVQDVDVGIWTDWYTNLTTTSHLYTGAQNNHTYAFRVRAEDNAGNVSAYACSDQTVVHIPPSTATFSPTTGFAGAGAAGPSLQLVPGTTVIITGTGLSGGVARFNGTPMEPTLSHVVNDSRIEAVIGVGTPTGSGPICVETAHGTGCSAANFQVVAQPFPVRWGMGFDNFSTPAANMSWSIFERAFGSCSVNMCPLPNPLMPWRLWPCEWGCPIDMVRRPTARAFYDSTRDVADGGDCYGFSYLTMDWLSGLAPSTFAAGADVPASLTFGTATLADEIRARQWRQKSLEAQLAKGVEKAAYAIGGPDSVRERVADALADGERVMVCIRDDDNPAGARGHCVNPYAVEGNLIRIYDNNWSYMIDGDQAMQRAIIADDDSWSYGTYGDVWPDPDNVMFMLPRAAVAGLNTIPSDWTAAIFGASGAGSFSVTDAQGGFVGYDETGEYIRTSTTVEPIVDFESEPAPIDSFQIVEPGQVTLRVRGTGAGAWDATVYPGDGGSVALAGVPLAAGEVDAVTFTASVGGDAGGLQAAEVSAGGPVAISTTAGSKPMTVTLTLGGGDQERSARVMGVDAGAGQPLTVDLGGGAGSLLLEGGSGGSYDVCLGGMTADFVPAEFCWTGIALGAGDAHRLTPEDWDALNTTRVRLEIDADGDGTYESSQWLVGHGLGLALKGTPAVLHNGDRITYTITYTVTGAEPASGLVLTTTVPALTTFVSATGGATPVGGQLTWALGTLAAGASGQVSFEVDAANGVESTAVGTAAWLRDASGRWAMASTVSLGAEFLSGNTLYLPLVVR